MTNLLLVRASLHGATSAARQVDNMRRSTKRGYGLTRSLWSRLVAFGLAMIAGALASIANAGEARAEPQLSTSLTLGGGIANFSRPGAIRPAFHLGGWADVLFGRSSDHDVGFGPHVHVATRTFQTFELGAGPTLLIPVGGPVFQISGSGLVRIGPGGVTPGAGATVFFGSRSYNFHGNYGYTLGGFLQGRFGFSAPRADVAPQADVILGVQADLAIVALPAILLIEAIRGPRDRR
jgi:hypothetical protein